MGIVGIYANFSAILTFSRTFDVIFNQNVYQVKNPHLRRIWGMKKSQVAVAFLVALPNLFW